MNRDPSLKATPLSRTGTTGVASSDGDCIAHPWVMQSTSLPLSGLHITHGYSNDRPLGVCDSNLSALNVLTDSLLVQVTLPTVKNSQ